MNATFVLAQLHATTLLVHCLTNTVVPQIIVSVLLATGAVSVMIDLPEGAEPLARIAPAVLINASNGSSEQHTAQRATAGTAHEADTPWVPGPVAVGALPVRTALARELLALSPATIRGNASEILGLAGTGAGGQGVNSIDPVKVAVEAVRGLADKHDTVVTTSGEANVVISASRAARIHGGDPLMPLVIDTGCSLGALVAAAFDATWEHPYPHDAVIAAHALFAATSVVTGHGAKGPTNFEITWCDALYALLPDEIVSPVTVEKV